VQAEPGSSGAFGDSQEHCWRLVAFLEGNQAAGCTHGELEELMDTDGRELLRQMYQNHLELRAQREARLPAVIEGACRHIVKDRMDLTGARWGLEGAEAVLKLRVLRSNGDWNAYWRFHLRQERRRVHESRYANGVIPRAA